MTEELPLIQIGDRENPRQYFVEDMPKLFANLKRIFFTTCAVVATLGIISMFHG